MVWFLIGLLAVGFLLVNYVSLRLAAEHPFLSLYYSLIDSYHWIIHKGYNNCPTGEMIAYTAHFGKGKTLSAVHQIAKYYKKYNNKKVWDRQKKRFVTQKIHIISNVQFNNIEHYEMLESLQQIVNNAYINREIDEEQDTRTVLLVLIDEASVQLNSRNFKSNIPPDFLNTLLTSRHYHMSCFYTSQKFNLTDKLLRDVTQNVIECKKLWRFQVQYIYDGTTLENASNPSGVRPIRRTGFFIRNKDFNQYDTLAVVDNLKKSVDTQDFLSEKEILELRASKGGRAEQFKQKRFS